MNSYRERRAADVADRQSPARCPATTLPLGRRDVCYVCAARWRDVSARCRLDAMVGAIIHGAVWNGAIWRLVTL